MRTIKTETILINKCTITILFGDYLIIKASCGSDAQKWNTEVSLWDQSVLTLGCQVPFAYFVRETENKHPKRSDLTLGSHFQPCCMRNTACSCFFFKSQE